MPFIFCYASQSANTYAPGLTTLLPCGHSYLWPWWDR